MGTVCGRGRERAVEDLISKLVAQLSAAGLHCAAAYSIGRLPLLTEPLIIVDCTVMLLPAAIGDCFGRDKDGGYYQCRTAEHTALLEVYAPYLGGGAAVGTVVREILGALQTEPEDYSMRSIRVGQTRYDPDSDCFRSTVSVRFDAFLVLGRRGGSTA